MGRLRGGRDWLRARREQVEARLADGQLRLEQARARNPTVDTVVGVLRRERPVAAGILASALAFRLFALLIPPAYVLVAGLGHVLAWRITLPRERRSTWSVVGLVVGVALVLGTSAVAERARAASSGLGNEFTALLTSAAVQVVLLAVLWFALSWALPRPAVPWTALVPGALLLAGGFLAFNLAVTLYFGPRAARASAVYGSLGVALVLLVSLFLAGRLAAAAAELNATLWERRVQRRRLHAPPP